jgi:hypothetical protein
MLTHAQAEQRSPSATSRIARIGRGRAMKGPDSHPGSSLQHSCHTPTRGIEANAMRNPALARPFVQTMQQMFHGPQVGADTSGPAREVACCLRENARSEPASSEAFPFSRPRWAERWPRCTKPMNSTLNAAKSNPATAIDFRALKAMLGILGINAAAASAVGVTMTPSLFGALAAGALSAGAVFAALFDPANCDHHCGWRAGAWVALGSGWIIVAATLLNAPLSHLDGVRILMSALIAASAALRASRWQIRPNHASLDMLCALAFALLALLATWSGAWTQGGDPTAINLGCSLELAGSGFLWLAEATLSRRQHRAAGGGAVMVAVRAAAVRVA